MNPRAGVDAYTYLIMQNELLIELINIVKSYDGKRNILNGLNFSLQRGDFVAILGESGVGKSTLLNIVGLFDGFDSGKYYLGGFDVTKNHDEENALVRNRYFGFVFQLYHLIPNITVEQNITMPFLYASAVSSYEVMRWKMGISKKLRIDNLLGSKVDMLSGGEKQRVAIARSLLLSPQILIADEPTGSLDDNNAEIVIDIFGEYKNQGHSIILVTHNKQIAECADKVYSIKDGVLVNANE
ncbi:MAG: ABC transporter ATP-binding protein [Clostridiales Family XIII bacterium]|jgi:putative ABC transport system ATP-binding protein|nr:ABC transporter ATP-binding protein [Clostridiales Family XIII bacterium]